MNKALITAVVLLAGVPASAAAQERAGAAALGAVSGAVVLGPIGAVAGAVVGYTAGPSIARSWGMKHSTRRDQKRSAGLSKQTAQKTTSPGQSRVAQNAPAERSPAQVAKPAAPPVQAVTPPPVQGFE